MLSYIDNVLNRVTMYRVVLYYLIALWSAALLFSFFGILPYDSAHIVFSTLVILATCWIVNIVFAKGFGATPNVESGYITALILALIIAPAAPRLVPP